LGLDKCRRLWRIGAMYAARTLRTRYGNFVIWQFSDRDGVGFSGGGVKDWMVAGIAEPLPDGSVVGRFEINGPGADINIRNPHLTNKRLFSWTPGKGLCCDGIGWEVKLVITELVERLVPLFKNGWPYWTNDDDDKKFW